VKQLYIAVSEMIVKQELGKVLSIIHVKTIGEREVNKSTNLASPESNTMLQHIQRRRNHDETVGHGLHL
jgi:hypothetical protein